MEEETLREDCDRAEFLANNDWTFGPSTFNVERSGLPRFVPWTYKLWLYPCPVHLAGSLFASNLER